jgi:hypothetical protein
VNSAAPLNLFVTSKSCFDIESRQLLVAPECLSLSRESVRTAGRLGICPSSAGRYVRKAIDTGEQALRYQYDRMVPHSTSAKQRIVKADSTANAGRGRSGCDVLCCAELTRKAPGRPSSGGHEADGGNRIGDYCFAGTLLASPGCVSDLISSEFFAPSLSESRSSTFLNTSTETFLTLSSAIAFFRSWP